MEKKLKAGEERKEAKALKLNKETLQRLTEPQLHWVAGGLTDGTCGRTVCCY